MKQPTRLPFTIVCLFLAVALVACAGCGKTDTAAAGNPGAEPDAATQTATAEKPSDDAEAEIVGDWRLDAEETIKANSVLLTNPGIDATAFRTMVRSMVSDFFLDKDNTLSAYEKADGIELDITGRWELKGNKIGLYQEFENEVAKKDELIGTVDGDRMDLVHEEEGFKLKMVLKKLKQP